MSEDAREKLLMVLPHIRHAMTLAEVEGKPMLGILGVKPGGAGRVVVQFEAKEFVDDLCRVLGQPLENTEDEKLDASAESRSEDT